MTESEMKMKNHHLVSLGVLTALLMLGAAFSSAQTVAATNTPDSNSLDNSPEQIERTAMPTSKDMPHEFTPAGVPIGQMLPTATLTPTGSVTPVSE
jgi:hypothetical protein